MKSKLSPKFWCALTVFSLIGQIAWVVENMYLNVFIYKLFAASADQIALMVSCSAVAATVTTIIMGAVSDKVGKRKLFMVGGYILWGISILGFALVRTDIITAIFPATVSAAAVGVSLVIILDCLMTFFGSTANDAAFNAWMTDSADESNRGAVEGINAMMPLVAILAVFGGFMGFDLDKAESWTAIFIIIGLVVLAVGVAGIFIIEDKPLEKKNEGIFGQLIYTLKPSTIKTNSSLYISLLAFAVFNISIQVFMPYLIIYYEVSLQMANYVFIMAPAIIIASVVTFFWGRVYDKKGFGFSAVLSLASLCLGYILLYIFKNTAMVFVGSLFMMCGYLSSMAVFGAYIKGRMPVENAGLFQGPRILCQVLIPGVVGPFIGARVLSGQEYMTGSDGTQSFIPNENIFLAALIVIIVLIPFVVKLSDRRTKK